MLKRCIFFVFISSSALSLSREVFSQAVDKLAIKHQQAGIQFLAYIVLVLVVSTV
ncbi:MAG: hypothetical protein ACJAXH_002630, partial [Colwellia sp.]